MIQFSWNLNVPRSIFYFHQIILKNMTVDFNYLTLHGTIPTRKVNLFLKHIYLYKKKKTNCI